MNVARCDRDRSAHTQLLVSLRRSTHKFDPRGRNTEKIGQEFYDGLVCFSVSRRRGRPQPQAAIADVQNFIPACAGLYTHVYQQVLIFLPIPVASWSHSGKTHDEAHQRAERNQDEDR